MMTVKGDKNLGGPGAGTSPAGMKITKEPDDTYYREPGRTVPDP
jgi:hypothetical protein